MGNYVLHRRRPLVDAVPRTPTTSKPRRRRNLIPMLVERGRRVYDFRKRGAGRDDRDPGYWRDVGTLDAFWRHMDLISVDRSSTSTTGWPILTWPEPLPPAKFVSPTGSLGHALDSMVCAACRLGRGALRSVAGVPALQRASRLRADARARDRPRRGGAPGDRRQERHDRARREDRRGPGGRPGALSRCPTAAWS
jgi:hypothetical protein